MIDFDVEFDSDELMNSMADAYARQLEENETECANEDCTETEFEVEIWVNENGFFEGEGRCLSCNNIFELDIEDSDAREAIKEIEDAVQSLEDAF